MDVIFRRQRLRGLRPGVYRGVVLAMAVVGSRAAAVTTYEVGGALDVEYSVTTPSTQDSQRLYPQLRPVVALEVAGPRLVSRFAYTFAGGLTLIGQGTGALAYQNSLGASVAAQLSPESHLVVSTGVTQGSTAFQLTQRGADAGQPYFRAPTDTSRVAGSVGETYERRWSRYRFTQSLSGSATTPQDEIRQYNGVLAAVLGIERMAPRDALGIGLSSSYALLRPLMALAPVYGSYSNSLVGRWNHDFDLAWNGQVSAGIQQTTTLTGSFPVSIMPTGSVSVRYSGANTGGSVELTYATTANPETGTVAITEQAVARTGVDLSTGYLPRTLAFSLGFLHGEPFGAVGARQGVGTGNAISADAGLAWGILRDLIATLRYSLAYQFDQGTGIQPSLVHVLVVGLRAQYSNGLVGPPPSLGGRVDGRDAVNIPGQETGQSR